MGILRKGFEYAHHLEMDCLIRLIPHRLANDISTHGFQEFVGDIRLIHLIQSFMWVLAKQYLAGEHIEKRRVGHQDITFEDQVVFCQEGLIVTAQPGVTGGCLHLGAHVLDAWGNGSCRLVKLLGISLLHLIDGFHPIGIIQTRDVVIVASLKDDFGYHQQAQRQTDAQADDLHHIGLPFPK